jgi:hypothetical protein
MYLLLIVVAILIIAMTSMLFEMRRTPPGIERMHHVEQHRIFSRTSTVTDATPAEAIRLLRTDWSWWTRARAETMTDLGDGRTEFVFHPVRFLDLIEVPPSFVVRMEPTETLPDGGLRIPATLAGDFAGRAEYTARPGPGGTVVELAWCGAEVRSVLRNAPIALVAAVHCWRERIGVQGLRARLASRPGR